MLIINPTISNKTLLPVLITDTLPLQREIPTNKNFVSKAIAIVQSAQSGDFEQLDAQLIRLEESSTYEEVRQHLPELIRQVQATQASKDLPTLYERLVKRLKIDDPLLVEDFSAGDLLCYFLAGSLEY